MRILTEIMFLMIRFFNWTGLVSILMGQSGSKLKLSFDRLLQMMQTHEKGEMLVVWLQQVPDLKLIIILQNKNK